MDKKKLYRESIGWVAPRINFMFTLFLNVSSLSICLLNFFCNRQEIVIFFLCVLLEDSLYTSFFRNALTIPACHAVIFFVNYGNSLAPFSDCFFEFDCIHRF